MIDDHVTADKSSLLDENSRRYYLDVMGIQCWQLVDLPELDRPAPNKASPDKSSPVVLETDVIKAGDKQALVAPNWPQLEQDILQCNHCALHQERQQALPGRGNRSADLMIVLLSPSAGDDAENTICSGEANTLLSKMLAAIKIDIADIYISSLLKCYAPQQHTVSATEIQSCQKHLDQQIQLIQPKVVMVLGETAASYLLQKDLSIDDYRAMNTSQDSHQRPLYQTSNIPLFFSYSPTELLQHAENKRKAWTDLQQLQKMLLTR
jgi:uracil-DNA glycosylase family 4